MWICQLTGAISHVKNLLGCGLDLQPRGPPKSATILPIEGQSLNLKPKQISKDSVSC